MRTAMVLAAGLGTRLRPLTDELPKPLVPVGDAPAIVQIARRLARSGVERIVVNTHHRSDAFDRIGTLLPIEGHVVNEPEILGTAGGVANARPLLDGDDVVVWNGDILADVDVAALVEARRANGAIAAWAIAPRRRGEGTVGVGEGGELVRVRDVRAGEEVRGGDFLGIQALGREVVSSLPRLGCLVGDVAAPLLARGARIVTVVHEGPWDDIGSPRAYLNANLRWLAERGVAHHVAKGARIAAGVRLEDAIVGTEAVAGGEGSLARVVVWPGARAVAPLADAIVTPRSTVKVA